MLATSKVILTLLGGALNSPRVDSENQVIRFSNKDVLLVPDPLLSGTFFRKLTGAGQILFFSSSLYLHFGLPLKQF